MSCVSSSHENGVRIVECVHKQPFVLTTRNWKKVKPKRQRVRSSKQAVFGLLERRCCWTFAHIWHVVTPACNTAATPANSSTRLLTTAVSLPNSTLLCVVHRAKMGETKQMAGGRTWLRNYSNHSFSSTENYDERTTEGVVKQLSCSTVSMCDASCLRRS